MSKVYHTVTRVAYTDKHPRYIRESYDEYLSPSYYERLHGGNFLKELNVLDAVVVNQFVTEDEEE